jgi:hypothetical protein
MNDGQLILLKPLATLVNLLVKIKYYFQLFKKVVKRPVF